MNMDFSVLIVLLYGTPASIVTCTYRSVGGRVEAWSPKFDHFHGRCPNLIGMLRLILGFE